MRYIGPYREWVGPGPRTRNPELCGLPITLEKKHVWKGSHAGDWKTTILLDKGQLYGSLIRIMTKN